MQIKSSNDLTRAEISNIIMSHLTYLMSEVSSHLNIHGVNSATVYERSLDARLAFRDAVLDMVVEYHRKCLEERQRRGF
jgi:hypothetical protein